MFRSALLAAVVVVVGIVAAFASAIVFGTAPPPPPLKSISSGGALIVRSLSDLPPIQTFPARDGTLLAFRRYQGIAGKGVAVLIHGSSGSSVEMHRLAKALAGTGITVLAVDMRGHGHSGRRGDIDYAGQLDNDMSDLVRMIARDYPSEQRILVGHSSGGGYALHVAASRQACSFAGYLALSPYLNYQAPTVRPGVGGWTGVYRGRLIALTILRRFGMTWFEGLPVVAFAIPPDANAELTRTYSFRLLMDFGLDADWKAAIARIKQPAQIFVGSKDELFYPDTFAPTFKALNPRISVDVIDGPDHMGIVLADDALEPEVAFMTKFLGDPSSQCALPKATK